MKPTKLTAAVSLVPKASVGLDKDTLLWVDPPVPPVSDEQIEKEYQRLLQEYEDTTYQRLRASEYPPITDYIDGVVKGDQAQIDKYIADCLAVKAKYPKP